MYSVIVIMCEINWLLLRGHV